VTLWPRLNDYREGNLGDTITENVSLNALPRQRLFPLTVGVVRRRGIVRPPATTPNLRPSTVTAHRRHARETLGIASLTYDLTDGPHLLHHAAVTRTGRERWRAIQGFIVSSTPLRLDIGTILLRQGKGGDLAVHLLPVHPIVAKTAEGAGVQNANSTTHTGRWTGLTLENHLDPGHLVLLETASFGTLGLLIGSHHLPPLDYQTPTSLPATVDAHPLPVTATFLAEGLLHPIGFPILAISTTLDDLLFRIDRTKTQRERGLAGQIHAHQEKNLEHFGDHLP
jgi:hypothetical protein